MATFSMCRILNNNNQGASDESGLSRTTYSVYLDSQTRQDYTSSQYLLQGVKPLFPSFTAISIRKTNHP